MTKFDYVTNTVSLQPAVGAYPDPPPPTPPGLIGDHPGVGSVLAKIAATVAVVGLAHIMIAKLYKGLE